MRVAVSGSSGLVGRVLCRNLRQHGHDVISLVRRAARSADEIEWNPDSGEIDTSKLSQVDAVIHLAGENIAAKRWTPQQKQRLRQSRIDATQKLASAIARCNPRPKVFVGASAIGYYGDRGDEVLNENSAAGNGFLAELCKDWELSARPAVEAGVRVVNGRIGVVLSKDGGALAKLLPIFQLGAGGPIGAGKQYMSWIDIEDLANALIFLIESDVTGPVNLVAPNAVTNAYFSKALGKVLGRPAFMPVPPFALQAMMGELADELLLSSQRVVPDVLSRKGFQFGYTDVESSFHHVLNK